MRNYIHERQSECIPAGLDPAAVAEAVQEPSSLPAATAMVGGLAGEGGDDMMTPKTREPDRDRRGLQWAYDTLEGTLSVARQSASGAIELLRDAWDSQFSSSSTSSSTSSAPKTSTVLYAVIAVLVLSNLWTLRLVGKRDGDGDDDNNDDRKDHLRPRQAEEREKWVQGIVTALWQELEAGRDQASRRPPIVPPATMQLPEQWREEVAELGRALDTVEERVRAVRQSLAELD